MKKLLFVFFWLLFILFNLKSYSQDRLTGKSFATRSVVMAQHGMACTSHPLATQAAIDVLKKGGNAIDAAIAANAVLGVTDPEMNGIGGDLFAIVYDAKTKKLYGLNASGRSPYNLTLDILKKNGEQFIPIRGALSVSVPGCVDGWFQLHDKFGKLAMKDILSYAINYARNGFPVADEAAFYFQDLKKMSGTFPNIQQVFMSNGDVPQRGEVFKNPQLANSLEKIANGGRDVFYKGDIAKAIDAFMKKNGGYLNAKDLADHTSEWVEPLSTTYRGYRVWELPPNGQGIAVLQMLNILENFDFSKISYGSAEHIHLFTEAKRLAYEDRAKYYADMQFAKVPVDELISKKYAAERAKLIDMQKANPNITAGDDEALKSGETIYLTVADDEGNMVSLIQSNFQAFGSGLMPDSLGFFLQDRGALFSLQDGQNNTYAPHKRPFHTIIPAFVTKDDQPYMSFGVMGGSFQPEGQVQVLMNMIDFGMNNQEAGDAPRIDHQGSSEPTGKTSEGVGTIYLESGFSFETIRALLDMGYKVAAGTPGNFGGYQCIQFDAKHHVYFGASDARKDGMAAGY
ncbi:MAG TPA: gamma-glutamyltransferase [Parafilimonas sp.]|nr:gamma-glutamyltransferase [Parafilimonas sp.]